MSIIDRVRSIKTTKIVRRLSFYVTFYCLIPLTFFVLIEMVLRVSDYGYPSGFFVKQKIGEKEYYVNNFKFSWRFFPKPIARLSASVVVPVEKDKNAFRVFVFGESAAMGDPDPSFSFSRMLQAQLELQYPDKRIEIYNTALTAINSHVLLPIVEDCLALEPDLFIIYSGNNEVIGPYGLSAALSPFFSHRGLIKTKIWFGQTKLGQLLASLSTRDELNQQQWRGMEMFMKNQVAYNHPDLETIYAHFESNLMDMCEMAHDAGVKVVLSTVVTNVKDCAPFLSLHNPSLSKGALQQWQTHFAQGVAAERAGNYVQAIGNYTQAHLLDADYAELNFRLGKCYLQTAQTEKAKEVLLRAQDLDALRFRADSRLNDIVKQVARAYADHGVLLADAKAAVDNEGKEGVSGNDVFYEHVHLNMKGNFLVAKSIVPSVQSSLGLSPSRTEADFESCIQRLAYTPFDEMRIDEENLARIKSAPFTSQYTNTEETNVLQNQLNVIGESWDSLTISAALLRYQKAIDHFPTDYFLRMNQLRFLFHFNYYEASAKEADVLFSLLPHEYLSLINLGGTRQSLSRYAEAEEYYKRAIALNPYFREAYKGMAALKEKQQQFYAVAAYHTMAHSSAEEIAYFYNRAGVHFAKGKNLDSAIYYFSKAAQQLPGFMEAQRNLNQALDYKSNGTAVLNAPSFSDVYNQANALFKNGNFTEAITQYQKAISLNPAFAQAYNNIGIAFIQLNKPEEALANFQDAIRVDPGFLDAYPNAAVLLNSVGRTREAIDMLQRGLQQGESAELYHLLAEYHLQLGEKAIADAFLQKENSLRRINK